jgi:hypothetical protein
MQNERFKQVSLPSPFLAQDQIVGESGYRWVSALYDKGKVVKFDKAGTTRVFDSVPEAIGYARNLRTVRDELEGIVSSQGSAKSLVPPIYPVLYDKSDASIGVAEVQDYFPDAQTLQSIGIGVLALSRENLVDMKNIFQACIDVWKKEKKLIDTIGSQPTRRTTLEKLQYYLLPVSMSRNIILDQEDTIRYVDVGEKFNLATDFRSQLREKVIVAGAYLSVGALNAAIALKKN